MAHHLFNRAADAWFFFREFSGRCSLLPEGAEAIEPEQLSDAGNWIAEKYQGFAGGFEHRESLVEGAVDEAAIWIRTGL